VRLTQERRRLDSTVSGLLLVPLDNDEVG